MELPMYSLIIGLLILLLLINLIVKRLPWRQAANRRKWIYAIFFVLTLGLIADKKVSNLKKEMNAMNERVLTAQMSSVTISNKDKIYSLDKLKKTFPNIKTFERPINNAIDIVTIRKKDPNAVVFISIIDLEHPQVKIKITPKKNHKYLTSQFAKETNCLVAINGEAGVSMAMDCELGEWSGNWVVDGTTVMMLDSDKRPFIGFNQQNQGTYFKQEIIDVAYTDAKYNTIWGRHDILVDGSVNPAPESKPYARTVMGINKEGNKLYLMIVDGKRPDYSLGLTYSECAVMMKSLGAHNAMACDQGGSSCMYVAPMGGIINRPADSDGIERKIYTHFGIAMQ